MSIKIGINGFGRIGRMVLRSIIENNRKDIDVVWPSITEQSLKLVIFY